MKGEPAAVPPRKLQRTQKQSTHRKQGRLADFMNLPTDVFTLIASYLLPLDILSLARSNKFFRGLLMTTSSRSIWLNAMKNVKGLPPCPSEMSEPEYVALLFTKVCSTCGTLSRNAVDEFLLIRLCAVCKRDKLMKLHELPEELHELVHYSAKTLGVDFPDIHRFIGVAIRDQADAILDKYHELAEADDDEAFKAWVAKRKGQTARRRKWAGELTKFLNTLETQRVDEKKELLETRRAQIKEKLLELGWEAGDLKFKPYSDGVQEWHELVEMPKQPRPLTDRVWKNLYIKLKPLLEINRGQRLEIESSKRQEYRRNSLDTFLYRIQHKEPPLLKVKPRQSSPTFRSPPYRPAVQRDVFPFLPDALELSFIQAMNEEDISVEAFRQGLEEHRSEIETFIAEWQGKTRTYLVDLIREEEREHSELLQPPKNMDPDAFARLSDDQKLLSRADSLFYVDGDDSIASVKRPYGYEKALRTAYPSMPEYPLQPWEPYEFELPDLDVIHQHAAAQEVARELLADLGKHNASFLEVNQFLYACERCHDKMPRDWTSIIEHYLQKKQIHAKVGKYASDLAREGITYNNVHDPTFYSDQPMIKPVRPKSSSGVKVAVHKCSLCVKKPISLNVTLSTPKLYKHLLDVHDVSQPKLNVHYHVPTGLTSSGLQPKYGYDYGEPNQDNEEVEADNEPEEEVMVEYYEPEEFEEDDGGDGEGTDSEQMNF